MSLVRILLVGWLSAGVFDIDIWAVLQDSEREAVAELLGEYFL
jgi:hypothetical protein